MTILVIQLTDNDAVIARFERRRNTLVFLQGARRPLSADGSLNELLEGFSAIQGEQKVILSISPSQLFARELNLPITDRKRAREVIPLELGGETAFQVDDLLFDAMLLGEGKAIAVWCRKKETADLIERLGAIGLEPEIVTASHLHWSHLLSPNEVEPIVVADEAAMMIGTPSHVMLVRPLSLGEGDQELSRTIAAFEMNRDIKVGKTVRHGKAAAKGDAFLLTPELREAFSDDTVAAADLAGAYATAKAYCKGDIINFRSGELAYTAGKTKSLKRLRLTYGLAAALIILLFLELGIRYFLVHRDVASLNVSINRIYKEIFPTRKKQTDAVAEVKSEIKRLSGGGSTQRVLPALKKLTELKGEEISGFYEVEFEGGQVRLKGDARSAQAVNTFKGKAAALFNSPEVSEIKSKGDGGVSFAFRGTIKEENR